MPRVRFPAMELFTLFYREGEEGEEEVRLFKRREEEKKRRKEEKGREEKDGMFKYNYIFK